MDKEKSESEQIIESLQLLIDEKVIEILPSKDCTQFTIALRKDLGLKPNYHTVNSLIGTRSFVKWLKESLQRKNIIDWE